MRKLLFQSDDYGLTDSVADGILKGIDQGIIRNTGLFVNMPSSARAAAKIRDRQESASASTSTWLRDGPSVIRQRFLRW